jgi:hypothetical protein
MKPHGRQERRPVRARTVAGLKFTSGAAMAKLFSGHKANSLDKAASDQIRANIAELDAETESVLRH